MCNINIVSNIKRKDSEKTTNLMNIMSWLSFNENDDGEGYLMLSKDLDDKYEVDRSLDKVIFAGKASTLVTHQRWLTSGQISLEYTHPFTTQDLVVFHNGVLDCAENGHSDTYIFSQRLQANYEKHKGDIKKAIEETHNDISGMYSIVIFEISTKKLYYYKNSQASFYYGRFGDYFVGSTKKENVNYACKYLGFSYKKIYTPKPHTLYDVLDDFKVIGELDIKTTATQSLATVRDYDYDADDYWANVWKDDVHKDYTYKGRKNRTSLEKTVGYWDNDRQCYVDSSYIKESPSEKYWREKEAQMYKEELEEERARRDKQALKWMF